MSYEIEDVSGHIGAMKNREIESTTRRTATVRGKDTNLLRQGTNIAILDPDVVDHFPDSEWVNSALRAFLAFGKQLESVIAPSRRSPERAADAGQELEFDPRTGRTDKLVVFK